MRSRRLFESRQNPRLSRTHRTDLPVQIVQFGEQFDMTFKPDRQEGQIAIQVPAEDRTGTRPLLRKLTERVLGLRLFRFGQPPTYAKQERMRDRVGRKVDVSRVGESLSEARSVRMPELGAHGHGAADFVLSMHENPLDGCAPPLSVGTT